MIIVTESLTKMCYLEGNEERWFLCVVKCLDCLHDDFSALIKKQSVFA